MFTHIARSQFYFLFIVCSGLLGISISSYLLWRTSQIDSGPSLGTSLKLQSLTSNTYPRAAELLPWFKTPPLSLPTSNEALPVFAADSLALHVVLEDHIARAGIFNHFFFVWSSPWNTWMLRHDLFLQTLLAHHPSALIVFIAAHSVSPASIHPLSKYIAMGYSVIGLKISFNPEDDEFPSWWINDENREWLELLDFEYDPLAYTHVTDYLRFYLLYIYGGTYTDVDALFLRTLPPIGFAGLDWSNNTASWFFSELLHFYLAPGVMRAPQRHLPMLREILETTFLNSIYDPSCFNCVGPKAFNKAISQERIGNNIERSSFSIFNPIILYPFSWLSSKTLFSCCMTAMPMMIESLRRRSLSIHLFGHATLHLRAHPESAIQYINDALSLAPNGLKSSISKCSLGGQSSAAAPGIVVIGDLITLRDANLIFIRKCDALQRGKKIELSLRTNFGEIAVASRISSIWLTSSPNKFCLIFSGLESLSAINQALASVTILYKTTESFDKNDSRDTLTISVRVENAIVLEEVISVLIFNRLVTVISHTHGRFEPIERLYKSVQEWYPDTLLLVSDDSGTTIVSDGMANSKFVHVLKLNYDVGLSAARNSLVTAAQTEYVFLMDDDFTVGVSTHLDYLLRILEASESGGRIDIASTVIPSDAQNFNFNFRGFITEEHGDLSLGPGSHGTLYGCVHVDFVPNVFMARRSTLAQIKWDDELKLGEHENFFLRAKKAAVRVVSCDHAEVTHHQQQWWTGSPSEGDVDYVVKRKRVYDFFKIALKKAGLKRLISFGTVMASVD
jgi:GT2 family glycosyltransferase